MKINEPTTTVEHELVEGEVLASRTDLKGIITFANKKFINISGFNEDELIGSNHNIVRHPDMPQEAFRDLWETVKAGRPWTGIVKNRCKNGDFYWVKATVTPVIKDGNTVEYMSTRLKPSRQEITAAEALYRDLNNGKATLKKTPMQRWLHTLRSISVTRKLMLTMALLLLATASIMLFIGLNITQRIVQEQESRQLNDYLLTINEKLESEQRLAAAMAALVAEMPVAQQALADDNRDELIRLFRQAFVRLKTEFGVTQFQFHTPPAISYVRIHKPDKFGDDLYQKRPTIVLTNQSVKPVRGVDVGVFGLGIRGLTPVFHEGKHLGSVEFGMSFGQPFFDQLKAQYGIDVSLDLFQGEELEAFASTLPQPIAIDPQDRVAVQGGAKTLHYMDYLDKHVALIRAPAKDFAGEVIGVLQVVVDRTNTMQQLASIRNNLLLGAAVILVIGLVAAYLLARGITRPLNRLVDIIHELINGNYNNDIRVANDDEVGEVLYSAQIMQARLYYNLQSVEEALQENLRIRTALDNVTSNVMLANTDREIMYLNKSVARLFESVEDDIRADLPDFDAGKLLGANIDVFHKNPAHQARLLDNLSSTHQSELLIGGRTMRIVANPVIDDKGNRLGTAVEWADRTQEVVVEKEIDDLVEAASAGDLDRRLTVEGKEGFFLQLSTRFNSLLDELTSVFEDIGRVMRYMAGGDLSQSITRDYEGTFGVVKDDINQTIANVEKTVSRLLSISDQVSTAAEEISTGNHNLSARTEQQAASLEQTASSMEELTSTVKNNASNAEQANAIAMSARGAAEKGGQVVDEAVSAMQQISESSNRIAEIIGVIDEIAFQTNLLALNASVEAARAGEQGRGFAVVATEVRNLASRSAAAAKEIKELIEDSVKKVKSGYELVNDTGESLTEIVDGVKKVGDIIAEIAAASTEQSNGIDQVNKAVASMDEVTQQNAALAEQTSAASAAMSDNAAEMNETMGFFKTSG
jgi:PAS domain S-box-containing protein